MSDEALVLIINCGSSSVKFSVLAPNSGAEYLAGIAEALGTPKAKLKWHYQGVEDSHRLALDTDHAAVINELVTQFDSAWSDLQDRLTAIGHRVVHGGEHFSSSVLINQKVIACIEECNSLAPLHNPAALKGIYASLDAFPQLPQVAVFDTAFHQQMPIYAYLYGLPYSLYEEQKIRRYGMHGSSYQYVSERCAELLGKQTTELNIIAAHLGGGSSICAINCGRSVDTSMGLTPLEGLVMGSRSGDLDPGILLHLQQALGYTQASLEQLLNRESGMLGISSLSSDCRTLEQAAKKDHKGAKLALEIFCYRLAKYIASYTIPLTSVDALVFTGGIGENSSWVRNRTTEWLKPLGYQMDPERNQKTRSQAEGLISAQGSPKILVIPTKEEWVIARDTSRLVQS
ncbi:acetate kinase [Microbulbifer sp. A4B17]|uniref:acetate/propionate family kinase n=1 Tax=Microbulbifer sp. A4B17 TaxID=359370 RepID=UPI000D52ACA7|nr:acetate kinase [Microbulbifer sp. A4B17]AWF81704.1 acetate kinase [Microbulbifer sp. A4B17]